MMSCSPLQVLPRRFRFIPPIIGGIMVHLSLGAIYSVGNMLPYITSYLRFEKGQDIAVKDAGWISTMSGIGQGTSMVFGGLIQRRFGARAGAAVGCTLCSLGTLVSYFTVKVSYWPLAMTYGLMFGLGAGIAYTSPIICATNWMPKRKGLVMGLIVAGFGCGAIIFNQVQTAYINPHNLSPDKEINHQKYFSNPDVLGNVPSAFLVLGGCLIGLQVVGIALMFDAPKEEPPADEEKLESISDIQQIQSLGPKEVVRSPTFYILWFTFLLNSQLIGFTAAYYKFYGQTFISDDRFLATVGSVAAIFNALGRIIWGSIADRFSYQVAMCSTTALQCFLYLTLAITSHAGKAMFFIWIMLIFGAFSATFSLMPFATARCFGQKNFGINYGLVFTAPVISAIISSFLIEELLGRIHYNGMFFLIASCAFASFVLNTLIGITRHGRPIDIIYPNPVDVAFDGPSTGISDDSLRHGSSPAGSGNGNSEKSAPCEL